ncbi:MAG: penicillin-binding transpeptidase domain-containing protein, partial [Solirubrobacterales bacterium]
MYLRSDERGPAMTNRLALRIALFGGVAVVLFAVLFFRLWLLQVLDGEKYLAEAKNNRTRSFRVSAPRGQILDRDGKVLVANRTSLALQVNPRKLPADPRERKAELARLADLTHGTLRHLRRTMHEELKLAPAAPVTLRRDVGHFLVFYLQENQDRFPGVEVQRVFVRAYPDGTLAAHIFGNVGEIGEKELKERRYRGLQPGDEIGQDGVEDAYDRFLRGVPGLTRIQVDALGQPTPNGRLVSKPPAPGDSLRLTIDSRVQEAGELALAERGLPGGFVTMDVHTGEILGLGSFPTFEPSLLTPPLTQKQVNETYLNPQAPLLDRAVAGLYPTGSTFKPITAIAALESGNLQLDEAIEDPGQLVVGDQVFKNAGEAANGTVSLVSALEVSSDVFFYTLGLRMWDSGELQHWAHALGIGRPTGIDLPGAEDGLLPSQHWRNQLYKEGETERPWSQGD